MLANLIVRPLLVVGLCLAGCIPAAAQSRADSPVYEVAVGMVPAEQRLDIDVQVTLPTAFSPADSITFHLDVRCDDPEVSVIEPSDANVETVARNGRRLTVTLTAPTRPGEAIAFRFTYSIGAARARSFYVTDEGAYISGEAFNWYPLPASTRRAQGRLRFALPDGFLVAATGRRAMPAPSASISEYQVSDPTTFSFAAGRHRVFQQEGSPTVAIHMLRPRSLVDERLEGLRRIVGALIEEFGSFPHPDLEIVEMPAVAAGGPDSAVSLEGFVVVGPDVMDTFSLGIVAHEVSHQWWADCVFAVGPSSVLLTETMAEYGVLRAAEAIYGARAAAEVRWRGYPGVSALAGGRGYLALVLAGLDAPLTSQALASTLPVTKGPLVYDLLSRTVGQERFRDFLQGFVRAHAFDDTTWSAFVAEATARFGDTIRNFVRDWYEREGVPEVTLAWNQERRELRGTIVQTMPYYAGEIEILALGQGRRVTLGVVLTGERTHFTLPIDFTVTSVRLDPDYKVPHQSAERRVEVGLIAPLGRALRLAITGGTDFTTAAKATLLSREAAPAEHTFLLDAILADDAVQRGDTMAARVHVQAALANPRYLPEFLPALYYRQAVLAAAAGDRELMASSASAAIATDAALVAPTGWGLAARELERP